MNRLAYISLPLVSFLENAGYYYAGCGSLNGLVEVGETQCIEYFDDWEIQTLPFFAIAHAPTGHHWMPWSDAPESAEFIKRIIRVGNQVSLERDLGGEL